MSLAASSTHTIQALLRSKRTLRLLADCSAAIVRSVTEPELLETICPLIVEIGGYRLVWIGYAQQDAQKRVLPMAQAGCSVDYIKQLNVTWSETERGQGPTGRAIRSGQTQIARNILQDQNFVPWRANAMTHGLFSSIALPLMEGDKTFAALNIYAHESDAFEEEEILLLEELAANLAYGISVLRLRREHHEALKERRKQERLCRAVVEQSADGIMITRLDGSILAANPASCLMTGYSEEALCRRSLCDLVPPGTQPVLLPLAAQNRSGSRELDMVRQDGSCFAAEMRVYPIILPDGQGEERAVLGVIEDISKRRQDEAEKHALQQQALQNAHLATVGVMAAGIVHEVNNPNNAIMFNATLLANAWKDVDIILNEYYQRNGDFSLGGLHFTEMRPLIPSLIDGITEHSERIKNIINNMQYIARNEQVAVAERLNLIELLKDTAGLLKNQIRQRTKQCIWELPETIPTVWGNRQQLEQVMINVILNALHALTDLDKAIYVALSATPESDAVLITVRDEGIGIAEAHLQRLTEPFFSTKLSEGGSGLGLFISNRIVENHGGEMQFFSREGEGTTVSIRLPVMEGDVIPVARLG